MIFCEYGHNCTSRCQEDYDCPCVNEHTCNNSGDDITKVIAKQQKVVKEISALMQKLLVVQQESLVTLTNLKNDYAKTMDDQSSTGSRKA